MNRLGSNGMIEPPACESPVEEAGGLYRRNSQTAAMTP
jgi:hypothetical protein